MRTLSFATAFLVLLIPLHASASSFVDVDDTDPYIKAIEWGKSTNVIGGYPDGTFQSQKTVNRAEFLKIILESINADLATTVTPTGFSDVDETAWYAPYVRFAKYYGIVRGYEDNTFRPEQLVNFAESLKIAYEAFGVETVNAGSEWYDRYLGHALLNNILFSTNVDMGSDMKRQDVVWIAWKLSPLAIASKDNTKPIAQSSSNTTVVKPKMLTSGNLYPINLLNNQQWKIRITTPVDVLDKQDVFEVSRNEDRFTLIAYELDQKNGGLDKSYTQDYKVRFTQRYTEPHDDFLEIYRCWYKYKHIQTGFTCHYIRVPTEIDERDVFGDDDFDGLITTVSEGFEVEILAKSKAEIECNVKGELHDNQKIYHLRTSKFYGDLKTGFKCFENESDAKKAGYKRSLSNQSDR